MKYGILKKLGSKSSTEILKTIEEDFQQENCECLSIITINLSLEIDISCIHFINIFHKAKLNLYYIYSSQMTKRRTFNHDYSQPNLIQKYNSNP